MAVKAEEVTLVDSENDESYQDYAEAEIDEPFDESAYQDHDQDGAGADFPTDSKGTWFFFLGGIQLIRWQDAVGPKNSLFCPRFRKVVVQVGRWLE